MGLTLCDGVPSNFADQDVANRTEEAAGEEDDNEVYIQDIAPDSLASIDGRLRKGDILLQVCRTHFKIYAANLLFNYYFFVPFSIRLTVRTFVIVTRLRGS